MSIVDPDRYVRCYARIGPLMEELYSPDEGLLAMASYIPDLDLESAYRAAEVLSPDISESVKRIFREAEEITMEYMSDPSQFPRALRQRRETVNALTELPFRLLAECVCGR